MNKITILLVSLFFIHGCASTSTGVKFTRESQAKIKNVTIEEIHLPNMPTYRGLFTSFTNSFAGATGGVIGGLAVAASQDSEEADKSDAGKIKYFLNKNNIDIKQIFTENLKQTMLETKSFKHTVANRSDAKFEINIISYGLNKAAMSFNSLTFFMKAQVKLIDNNNNIIWDELAISHHGRESYDDWLNNSNNFDKSIRAVIKGIVEFWFNNLVVDKK